MSQFTCAFDQLDDDTQKYLRDVRTRRGDRTPGIYSAVSNPKPVFAFLIGPVVIVLALAEAFLSNKDGWAVALLQTAGIMFGGWLILYAFRRWLGFGAGFFDYFDPANVYRVRGETVTVTNLEHCSSVSSGHTTSGGTPVGAHLRFEIADRSFTVPVRSRPLAEQVEDYYAAVDEFENSDDPAWRSAMPAAVGSGAKHAAVLGTDPPPGGGMPIDVTDVPAAPRKDKRGGSGCGRLLGILLVGGLVFAGCAAVNGTLRDARQWADAQAAGAPGIRGYLLDERNTMHRDEAKAALARLYEPAIQKVRTQVKDEAARAALEKMLTDLRDAPQPVVSIRVASPAIVLDPARIAVANATVPAARRDVADAIGTHLGKELIGFVEAPEGVAAHFELTFEFVAAEGPSPVKWQLAIRSAPDAPPATLSGVTPAAPDGSAALTAMLREGVFKALFDAAPPVIPPPPPPDGDF